MFYALVDLKIPKTRCHKLTGLAPSSLHERLHPGHRRKQNPTPHRLRRKDVMLTQDERALICKQIDAAPELPIQQIYYQQWDHGQVTASLSSYYRIAKTPACVSRGPQSTTVRVHKTPRATPPQLVATRPYQTLVWDITTLPLVTRGHNVYLHCVVDLYSRAIVGWGIDEQPNTHVAEEIFTQIIATATAQGHKVEVIHSDNGSSMKSRKMQQFCKDHKIVRSHSRPRISDDNPHVESSFATLKNDPTYPKVFDDKNHAHNWIRTWVIYYNTKRAHSALAFFTPDQILTNTWKGTWAIRNAAKQRLYEQNPTRFRHQRPHVPTPKPDVYFNLTNTPEHKGNKTLINELMQ